MGASRKPVTLAGNVATADRKPRHPCETLSAECRTAFEAIATGMRGPAMTGRTKGTLLRAGLIVQLDDKPMRDRMGEYSIPQYDVPIGHHAAWCEWCSAQPENRNR